MSGEQWRIPPPPPTNGGWFGIEDPADRRWLATFIGDEPALYFQQPVRIRDPRSLQIPQTHIDCLRGPSPKAARRPLPARQPNGDPAVVWELDVGHDCMVSTPEELTQLLLRLAVQQP